jgi:imidazolonepropionase-like amidohydrolase
VPPYALRKAREVMAAHQASFRMAVDKGVKIAMGTDTGVGPHGTNAEELERMVEGGMTPMQAIVATTKSAAECARIAHLTGTLEVGKRADILGVDGDPLSDISILQHKDRLPLIVKDGTPFRSFAQAATRV